MPFQFPGDVTPAQRTRIIDAFCVRHRYSGKDPQGNAETKPQFFQRRMKETALEPLVEQEEAAEGASARQTARARIQDEFAALN